ncbi:hypothetical protein [Microvirga roseola]|uniref:hypothetical protein n=1 Tax=Microvirga roseola TaxID=2883126 RepID=UPI001E52416C|nr:hypothetical protein [Microvirga roseola]
MRQALTFLVALIISLAGTSWTLAQVVPPPAAPAEPVAPPAAWYEGYSWWWIILVVIIIAGLIWYFARARRGPRY